MAKFFNKKGPGNIAIILAVPLIMALSILKIKAALSPNQIKAMLTYVEPLFLWANLLLLALGIWRSRVAIMSHYRSISTTTMHRLLAIVVLAFVIRAFVAPQTHRLYYDEDIYLNIAQNMIYDGRAVVTDFGSFRWDDYTCHEGFLNKQPNAFPAFVSIFFLVLGVNEKVVFFLTVVVSSLTPLLLFLLVQILYRERVALWCALIYSLIPVAIVWSTSASTEPYVVFFTALSFFLFALFCKEQDLNAAFAAFMSLAFTIQFRPEGVLLLVPVFLYLLFFNNRLPDQIKELRLSLIWTLFCIIMALHALHILSFLNENWGALDRARFGFEYLQKNLSDNLAFFLVNREFPVAFTLCALIGLFCRIKEWKKKTFIISWFLVSFLPFLFFYAGSFRYGVDVRFSLFILCPLSILCGLGMDKIREMVIKISSLKHAGTYMGVVLILLFLPHLTFIRTVHEEAWQARWDHDFIVEESRKLPRDAIIFSHTPYVIILNAQRGSLQCYFGSNKEKVEQVFKLTNNVYFYRDYWCYSPTSRANYEYFCEMFNMTPVATEKLYDRDYTLYRITRRANE